MFIKNILLNVRGCKHAEIMVFEGSQDSFFSCFEIISSNDKQYLFNFEVIKGEDDVTMHIHINGVNKEFKEAVHSIIDSIKDYYTKECESNLPFKLKKSYYTKEIVLDFLHLKGNI